MHSMTTFYFVTVSLILYFRNFLFVRVCSLVGRYFYNMYTVKMFQVVFFFKSQGQ